MSSGPDSSSETPLAGWRVAVVGIALEGGLALLALPLGWLLATPPLATFAWDAAALGWGVLATGPLVAVFLLVYHLPGPLFAPMKRFVREVLVPLLSPCPVVALAAIALLAGLGEEMLFRGVVQTALARELPLPWAVVLASALFGVLHACTLDYIVYAAVLGAYLGWVWLLSGNLLVPIVAHALYDFVVLLYLRRPQSR